MVSCLGSCLYVLWFSWRFCGSWLSDEFGAPHLSYLVRATVVKHNLSVMYKYNRTPGAAKLLTTIYCASCP